TRAGQGSATVHIEAGFFDDALAMSTEKRGLDQFFLRVQQQRVSKITMLHDVDNGLVVQPLSGVQIAEREYPRIHITPPKRYWNGVQVESECTGTLHDGIERVHVPIARCR